MRQVVYALFFLQIGTPGFSTGTLVDPVELDGHYNLHIQLSCSFTTRCVQANRCKATMMDTTLVGSAFGHGKIDEEVLLNATADLSGTFGSITLTGHAWDSNVFLAASSLASQRMLSISSRRAATYTVHQGSVAITYRGTCEDKS